MKPIPSSKASPVRANLAIFLICIVASMTSISARAAIRNMAVIRAVQHRICFEEFWWNRDTFKLGKTVPITFRKDENIVYVWSEELAVVPGASRWANFFTVFIKDGQSVVGSSYGYNLDYMQGAEEFEKKKSQAISDDLETVQLRVPVECAPRFAKGTPLKERILRTIETTMANELMLLKKSGGAQYPEQLQIVIANFNADYPETQVFVPVTKQIFHVVLRDSVNPLSDKFLKQGEFPVRPENSKQAAMVLGGKVIKFGISREISLGGD